MIVRKLAARSLAGALGLLLALSLVLVPVPALVAMPQSGHIFYGHVTSEGVPVAEGTPITIRVPDGPDYNIQTLDAEGSYGKLIPADNPDTPEKDGAFADDLIEFWVEETLARTYVFEIRGDTELDLEADITAPSAPDAALMTVNMNALGTADTIEGDAGAVEGDSTVEVWDGSDPSTASAIGSITATAEGSFAAIDIGDNLHDAVWITAKDAENNRSDATEMTNDIVAPEVAITSPEEGEQLNSLDVTIVGTATEVDEVVVDDLTAPVVDGAFSIVLTLTEGANSITAIATDTASNEGSATVDFTINVTDPVVASTVPLADAPDVAIVAPVTATFDEDVTLVDETGVSIMGSISGDLLTGVSLEGRTLTIGHEDFVSGEDITVTIVSGVVEDLAGNPNAEYTWSFTAVTIFHTLTMAVTGSGTIDPPVGEHSYAESTVVDISATADTGWEFDSWTGEVADTSSASTTVTMDADKTVTATFTQDQYTLTVNIVGDGTVTKNPDEPTYTYGDVVELTAVPAAGWSFSAWSVDLIGTASPADITMDADKTVTATFTQDAYTLTVNIVGDGTVTKNPDEPTYTYGDVVELTAVPAAGWSFSAWSVDLIGTTNPDSITMDGNKTVIATFTEIPYTLTVNSVGSGSVTKDPDQVTYTYGDVVQLTAVPDTGWSFDEWSGDLTGTTNPDSITMDGNKTVIANFTLITYALTMAAEPEIGGTATDVTGLSPYEEGATVSIKAEAAEGYRFVEWTATAGVILAATQAETTFTMPGEIATATATFALQTFTITPTAGNGGSIDPSAVVEVNYGGSLTFTITPAEGYEIEDVLVDGESVGAVESYLFENVTADRTIYATFAVTITHELTMLVVGEGTVSPGDGTYPEGDMTITATIPASGWEFAGWSTEDMAEIADPPSAETTLTLDKDKTVTATFTEVVTYDLTVASTGGGTVTSPIEGTSTHNAGTVVNLVAVPEDGYTFGWWSGDVVADANAASTTITMDSAKSIVANFIEFSAPENISVTEMDPGVESITVTIEPVEELDVTQMPAGIDPQEAYVVAPTGEGSFTLIFSDVLNASDIRVYKVVDGTWTLLDMTVVDATIKVTMDVADPILVFALPPATIGTVNLPAGWNLLSTPIKLDAGSDSVEQILGESVANIELSYRWDAVSEKWAIPTGYELSPLEAIYLKVKADASATAEFIPSQELSWLPSRQLQPGLNLIGPAPAFDLEAGVFPDTPLDEALASIETAGEFGGYCMVVSPAHNQPDWAYALGMEVKDLLPYKGYWVVMDNADTMYGFSTTPISP